MPTMNDVAKLAGVSRGTVSNFINGKKIKLESQKKIQSAIKVLNYVPNVRARELKMNRSNLVVFILPTTLTPFFAELAYEMQQELKKLNYKMLLCNSNNNISEELEYLQMAKEQMVAGIITISNSDLEPHLTNDLPIVSIEHKLAKSIPCISSDNYYGGKLAAQKLIEKKAEHLLLINRSTAKTLNSYGKRARGFQDYCLEQGIDFEVFDSVHHENQFYPALQTFLENQFKEGIRYDGIFAVADQYVDFSLTILESLGYAVPEQIQLIGFDGGKMYPEQQNSFSSIRQPVNQIAHYSVATLQGMMAASASTSQETVFLPVTYIEGRTTIN